MPDSRKLAAARENTLISLARFSGLDRLDCLMILVAVLLGTIAERFHLWASRTGSSNGFRRSY
jgi:hypothetical protein